MQMMLSDLGILQVPVLLPLEDYLPVSAGLLESWPGLGVTHFTPACPSLFLSETGGGCAALRPGL